METTSAWSCAPYEVQAAVRLCEELGIRPATAAILVRRGYADPGAAREFLAGARRPDAGLGRVPPAPALPGVPAACEAILRHVAAGSRIAVFGDYDVDGVCSTAMMVGALRGLGADPIARLPSRAEGYGLSAGAVRELAVAGAELLVTVDCGLGSPGEIALARELGIDCVVCDHHRPGTVLPDCPIVHPALGAPAAPGDDLCAAGVVLKLSEALRARADRDANGSGDCARASAGGGAGRAAGTEPDLDLAGLATVCDMVSLRGENRRIARQGLVAIARTQRPGLRALMAVAGLEAAEVDARAASFRLGPRLNAPGRLHSADAALELLLTEDEPRAQELARELDLLNLERRQTEQRILFAAEAACRDQLHSAAIVVTGEGWHPGVVGVVASRLVERHHRPCVVIGLDGARGRGSGRSIRAYDLHGGLEAGASHLLRYGGHPMAAGLELEEAAVPGFRRALATHAGERLAPADLVPVRHVDAVVPPGALTLELAEELERLGPFGVGNPAPCLLVPAARIEHVTAMGEDRAHARFSLASGGARARGVAFRTSQGALAATGAEPHDAAIALERNRWNGAVEARVVLRSLGRSRAGRLHEVGVLGFWEEVERELDCDPAAWWPDSPASSSASASADGVGARGERRLRDRRGEGLVGIAGDLLTSGEPVLLVAADLDRRRASLEALVAGMAPEGLAAVTWSALGTQPRLAVPYAHLLVLDPPPVAAGEELLQAAPGAGLAHLAWGSAECSFALAYWRSQLGLRPSLAELWRALSGAGPLAGELLERVLRGGGAYPRGGALCGRLLRVLSELGLVELDRRARRATAVRHSRTELDRSPAYRAYATRLAAAERHLTGEGPGREEAPIRRAG